MLVPRRCWLPLAVLAAFLAALPLAAQLDPGAFSGTVRDEEGQPLESATVVFRGIDFTLRRQTQTDKLGRFYSGGFRPGRYHIIVLRQGRILWSQPVTLPPTEALEVNVDLKKLREAAERVGQLDPELEHLRDAERQRRQLRERLQRHYNRGARHLCEGRPAEAIPEFQAALELEPDRGATRALLGDAYAAVGRRSEAIASYRRALQLEPNEAAHHNNLAALLAKSGRLQEALPHFEQAAQLDPEGAATYLYNSGAAQLNAGRPEEALPALRQAVRSDPALAVAHYFLGLALFRTSTRRPPGQGPPSIEPRPGTIEAFRRYLQLAPDGEYAEPARDYLKQLGVLPPEILLPEVSPPEGME